MKTPPPAGELPAPLVFFDGVCGLCNAFVDFALHYDSTGNSGGDTGEKLRFAPLQGETAARVLEGVDRDENGLPRSLLFWDGEKLYARSDAVLRILVRLGGLWRVSVIFLAVPRRLRDWVYGFVAKHRYAWFGKRETCRLPTVSEQARFLP